MPSGICSRCRNLLLDIETGKQPMDCLPDPFDFSKVVSPSVATRNNPSPSLSCQCMICLVARSNPVTSKLGKRFSTSQTPTPGRPPTACTPDTLPSPRPIRVCKHCWQPVGRGVSHPSPCTASDARDNVIQRVQDVPRAAEILSSDVIRQKAGTSGTVTLATRGRDLTVEVGKTSKISKALFQNQPVPVLEVQKFQSTLGLSSKQTRTALAFFRTWKGRGAVETGAREKLSDSDRDLSEFYTLAEVELESSRKDEPQRVLRTVVYCKNLNGLIEYVLHSRDIDSDFDSVLIKVGIDGGGDFLKFCLNVIRLDDELDESGSPERKRFAGYSEGACAANFKDSGVKKLFIIAIVAEVKESYENVNKIVGLTQLDQLTFTPAFDLKLANVFLGLGPHSSLFPCPSCEIPKSDFSNPQRPVPLRTFGDIRRNAAAYKTAVQNHTGKKKLSAAPYKSCVEEPLMRQLSDDTLVLNILPVMELHVLLGVVNRLYDHLDTCLCVSEDCLVRAKNWSDKLSIRRPVMHGGEWNGNQCKHLLNNIPTLEDLLTNDGKANAQVHKVVKAFKDFNEVRVACFGRNQQSNYKDAISSFEISYKDLTIPMTSKVHAVTDHITQFLDAHGEGKHGLGVWSEQASETVHSDFQKLWLGGGYKRDLKHPDYSTKLLACVVTYCSRHIMS